MYESIHVRITVEQYEWLRRYCFENRVAQAEVVREALDMFRNQLDRALRKELGLTPERVSVTNPWTGAWVHIERDEVTTEKMDAMARLMEDDIREELHREHLDDPWAFWVRYVEWVGPERAGEVWFA